VAAGHGGARPGAGRKNKALAEKVLNGNPGCRKLKILEFPSIPDLKGEDMPSVRDYLTEQQKDGKKLLSAEIYAEAWNWLNERGCAALIPVQMLEQYSMSFARCIQCEQHISEYGFLAKHPTTQAPMASPFVSMSQSYSKQASTIWYQIFQIVRENCSTEFKGNPHDDMMEKLLNGRQ
jgi:hypothetical protein